MLNRWRKNDQIMSEASNVANYLSEYFPCKVVISVNLNIFIFIVIYLINFMYSTLSLAQRKDLTIFVDQIFF